MQVLKASITIDKTDSVYSWVIDADGWTPATGRTQSMRDAEKAVTDQIKHMFQINYIRGLERPAAESSETNTQAWKQLVDASLEFPIQERQLAKCVLHQELRLSREVWLDEIVNDSGSEAFLEGIQNAIAEHNGGAVHGDDLQEAAVMGILGFLAMDESSQKKVLAHIGRSIELYVKDSMPDWYFANVQKTKV